MLDISSPHSAAIDVVTDAETPMREDALEGLLQQWSNTVAERQPNVGTNAELDRLVDQAQQVVSGVRPQSLRDNSELRQNVATKLSGVQSVLDGLLVDRPRRNIQRRPR